MTDRTTTLRIALCLNGGVSLAVWMSGVVHELDLVRRASQGLPPCPHDEPEHYAAWREFCAARGVRVEVDVVAGTSAGGLNGAILARALARGADLPDLRALWTDAAVLDRDHLLPQARPTPSLLDGDYFARVVSRTLAGIDAPTGPAPPVTLFLTATALGRSDRRFRDACGREFDVPDHRRVYRFRSARRLGLAADRDSASDALTDLFPAQDVDDFAEDPGVLARAARASAGFPLAFAPVEESPQLRRHRHPRRDGEGGEGGEPTFLVDGGILDNAPLGPILDEIATRHADGHVRRTLLYVVPSNGVTPPGVGGGTVPSWLQIVRETLALPREVDLRGDVEQIGEVLAESRFRTDAAAELLAGALAGPRARAQLLAGASAARTLYHAARVTGTITEIRTELAHHRHAAPRLGAGASPRPGDGPGNPVAQVKASWALGAPTGWQYGVSGAMRSVRLLIRLTREEMAGSGTTPELAALAATLGEAADRVAAVDRAVGQALYGPSSSLTSTDPDDAAVTAAVNDAFAARHVPVLLERIVGSAAADFATRHGTDGKAVCTLLEAVETVTGALAPRPEEQAPPPFDFVRLGPDVAHPLLPDHGLSDDKLYGTRLMHFGAFGDEEWRRWDWTWGRLDAAAHLVSLVERQSASPPRSTESERTALEEQIVAAEGRTVDAMRERLARIAEEQAAPVGEKDAALLRTLQSEPRGRAALQGLADAVFAFLAQDDPRLPALLRRVDAFGGVALDRTVPRRPGLRGRLVRLGATIPRRRLWRWIEGDARARAGNGRNRGWRLPAAWSRGTPGQG